MKIFTINVYKFKNRQSREKELVKTLKGKEEYDKYTNEMCMNKEIVTIDDNKYKVIELLDDITDEENTVRIVLVEPIAE